MLIATHSAASDPPVIASLLMRTGHSHGSARFDSGMHHLHLITPDGPTERVDLGFSGSRLLARLLETPGEVVSREELIACAWPERVVGQGSLNQQIYTLRQILGDEKNREIIQTLPRRGYLLNPGYVLASETSLRPPELPEPAAPVIQASAAPSHPQASAAKSRWRVASSAVLALAAVLGVSLAPSLSTEYDKVQVGGLEVLVLEADAEQRDRLIEMMQPTLQRLTEHADGRVRLAISQASDYYALHCIHGAHSHTLVSHGLQLPRISDASLRECLQ